MFGTSHIPCVSETLLSFFDVRESSWWLLIKKENDLICYYLSSNGNEEVMGFIGSDRVVEVKVVNKTF